MKITNLPFTLLFQFTLLYRPAGPFAQRFRMQNTQRSVSALSSNTNPRTESGFAVTATVHFAARSLSNVERDRALESKKRKIGMC